LDAIGFTSIDQGDAEKALDLILKKPRAKLRQKGFDLSLKS
jgi:hypothetical protein